MAPTILPARNCSPPKPSPPYATSSSAKDPSTDTASKPGRISGRIVDGRPYEPSAGFWADLITSFDGAQKQLYRYQAVVVNLLLLLVGIYHVAQHLAYPYSIRRG
ncbi:hypothetical protein LMG28727_02944 [Paraburkholderia kirstenboschensis]|uniref:hypothetical protein n=1 Tax=Paraburkholderia kirstenboschensis TaxID=1245436 RepID=UPI000A6AD656|nr:hypothetical protein [Paraburkholderia kirstenboschensis]CAD6532501.1 hypothetical protein LMG28727_02944 [Paraburkholderia kirstenboschensis]